jgi:hypothetical protein
MGKFHDDAAPPDYRRALELPIRDGQLFDMDMRRTVSATALSHEKCRREGTSCSLMPVHPTYEISSGRRNGLIRSGGSCPSNCPSRQQYSLV